MVMEKKKYPIGAQHYTLYEEVGTGASAYVYRALCVPLNEVVAVKILDFERDNVDLNNISREAQTMVLVDHPNVLKSHCSFVSEHNLWVVMPYMAGGSCLHILKATQPDGFEEVVIATILREALKGLDYLHQHGHIHRDVKAGNILIDSRAGIKLGDFGVSAYLFDSGDRQRMRNTFVGTPCWMAPEVMEQVHGYDFKADIWSFGITALELAHGHAPFSKYPPMKVLLMTLQNEPPSLDYERDKKFSKSFKNMIAMCLCKDPTKRPTAKKLLKHPFFKKARSNDYITRTLVDGLPALGDRLQELKRKEEDMLAQKKMPDGEKEEISQKEYKRGISCWDFNVEDLKAESALLPDDEIPEKDEEMQAKLLQQQLSLCRELQHQLSFASQHSDAADSDDNGHAVSSPDSAVNTAKSYKSDDDVGACTTAKPTDSENQAEDCFSKERVLEADGKESDGPCASPTQRQKVQNQSSNISRPRNANLQTLDNAQPEISKESKTPVNGDEVDEKAKNPVIQQKGRFKVTSENVEMEKLSGGPTLQKSHSIQVIAQHPASSLSLPSTPLTSASVSDGIALGHAIYPGLLSLLQSNILQRDNILSMMNQISVGEILDADTATNLPATEKSVLQVAHDREKELLNEITDLHSRLISAHEELQKYRKDNAQINP